MDQENTNDENVTLIDTTNFIEGKPDNQLKSTQELSAFQDENSVPVSQ